MSICATQTIAWQKLLYTNHYTNYISVQFTNKEDSKILNGAILLFLLHYGVR